MQFNGDDGHVPLNVVGTVLTDPEAIDSFRAAFIDCYRPLLAYALRRTESAAHAHDVVADVFLVAWRRRQVLPENPRELRMWLFGTARRVLANHHRTELRARRLEDRLASLSDTSEAILDEPNSFETECARRALRLLAQADQELILLSVWEELPNAEIAGILGMSRANVAVRLHRAKNRLREKFADTMQASSVAGHVLNVDNPSHRASDEPTSR